jgi:transposase
MWNSNILFDSFRFIVTKVDQKEDKIIFHVRKRRKTADCSTCHHRINCINAIRKRIINHGTILGKQCKLVLYQRRFFCCFCNKVFSQPIEFAGKYQRVTSKHKQEVIFNLSDRSFSSGTKRYAVSYHTQRKWLNELIQDQILNFKKEEEEGTSFVLGIDEVSFAGKQMVTTIGNITKHRLKGVLSSRRKDELKKVLRSLSPKVKSLISEVVIDMCEFYLKAVKATLPNATVVVDHFHLIQDANRRLNEQRLLLQDILKKKIPRYILNKNKEDLKGQ